MKHLLSYHMQINHIIISAKFQFWMDFNAGHCKVSFLLMLLKKRRWHISNWIWICVTVGDRYLIIALKVTPTKCSFTDIKYIFNKLIFADRENFQPFWLSSKSVDSISKGASGIWIGCRCFYHLWIFFYGAWLFFLSTLFECWIDFIKWMGKNNIKLTSKLNLKEKR